MNFIDSHLLTVVIFSPLLGLVPLLVLREIRWQRWAVLLMSLIPLLYSIKLFLKFRSVGDFEFAEKIAWIPRFHVNYHLGVDGFSLPLILLTTFLTPIVILGAWNDIRKRTTGFYGLLLFLEVGMLGVFLSLDLFLFYVFWETVLIPMYFIIGVWGGARKVYAAIKFVLYTLSGSLLMLAAILYLYFAGGKSFSLIDLYSLSLPMSPQLWLFSAFALAFAIKIPLFPFHTWLPDAHVEAPTAGSVILAGVLLKMGTYGFVRFAIPLFPQAMTLATPLFLVLSVIGIIYGALVSMMQPDLKKLIAYSSVSHLGFVMLGLSSMTVQGVAGASLQMVNHGLSTGALFLLAGMIYERRHTRQISEFGGLASPMPIYATLFLVIALSSMGLPLTNGFIGEFLILIGAFRANPIYASFGAVGVVLGAVYLLWMIRRVFFGPITHEENRRLLDLNLREILLLLPIVLLVFWIGIAPGFLLKKINPTVDRFLERTVIFHHGVVTND
ncbi:MAG: NADH-quinone oxidoreductase subunit M [Deltaproteobacteria bacterium]|nr:NADH-quinone oxidoreductase subunit M [Deltaproteobacteria bacterium]